MAKRGRKPIGTERPAGPEALQRLRELLVDKDYDAFAVMLASVVKECGIKYVAERTGIRRESFYRFFTDGKGPSLHTMMKIAEAIGLQMTAGQMEDLKHYFSDDPYNLEEHLGKKLEHAKALGKMEKYDEAEGAFDAILSEYPDCWEAKSGRAALALVRRHNSEGEELFRQLLDEYSIGPDGLPKNAEACSIACINLGAIESQKATNPFSPESLEKRILYYRLAVDLNPEDVYAVGLLCMNLVIWGRPGFAERYYRDAGQEKHEKLRKSIMDAFKSLPPVEPDLALRLFSWLSERKDLKC